MNREIQLLMEASNLIEILEKENQIMSIRLKVYDEMMNLANPMRYRDDRGMSLTSKNKLTDDINKYVEHRLELQKQVEDDIGRKEAEQFLQINNINRAENIEIKTKDKWTEEEKELASAFEADMNKKIFFDKPGKDGEEFKLQVK